MFKYFISFLGDDFIKQCLDEKPPEPFRQDTDTRASQPCESCPTASQPPSAPGESRTHCSTPNSTIVMFYNIKNWTLNFKDSFL